MSLQSTEKSFDGTLQHKGIWFGLQHEHFRVKCSVIMCESNTSACALATNSALSEITAKLALAANYSQLIED